MFGRLSATFVAITIAATPALAQETGLDVIVSDANTYLNPNSSNGSYTAVATVTLRNRDKSYWLSLMLDRGKLNDVPNVSIFYVKLGFAANHIKMGPLFGQMPLMYWDDKGHYGSCSYGNGPSIAIVCKDGVQSPPN